MRAAAAIFEAHKAAGHLSPQDSADVRHVLRGIRRTRGTAAVQKQPILAAELVAMLRRMPLTLRADRDRAMLLLGFFGALRRSELAALDVDDVAFTETGATIRIRWSKTDQEGESRTIGIPRMPNAEMCPVRVLLAWIDRQSAEPVTQLEAAHGLGKGPLFREITRDDKVGSRRMSDKAVARAVKRLIKRAGGDPDLFAGHSLRSGFITSAARAGKREHDIMRQTGHRSVATLRGYIRNATVFEDNAAQGLL
jgi:integrase